MLRQQRGLTKLLKSGKTSEIQRIKKTQSITKTQCPRL